MGDGPTVSVIVASRGRPKALQLCLTGLGQVQYHPFEVIVVADGAGLQATTSHALADRIKTRACDVPNLSLARNLGLAVAAGEIVVFLDDDAIPEPGWLTHLTAPFADMSVAASGGFVLGRNGISLQWAARKVDTEGWHQDLTLAGDRPEIFAAEPGWAIRTEGTNMAIRREQLVALDGFDQTFRYFLDDTDLNMRLARSDARVAMVPKARVFHMQAPSEQRSVARVPRSLHDIGRSTAAFLARYAKPERIEPALADHRQAQRQRALRHMVSGGLVPGDVGHLMQSFDAGVLEGRVLTGFQGWTPPLKPPPFQPLNNTPAAAELRTVSGWAWQAARLRDEARDAVKSGALVQAYRCTPTALFHRRRYVSPGVWLQTGGVYGRSERQSPLIRATTLRRRVVSEAKNGPFFSLVCERPQK